MMSCIDFSIIDVGHGNSALIVEPGCVTLVDVGRGRTVAETLKAAGIFRINTVLVSHADSDHCGGLLGLLLDRNLLVDRVVLNSDGVKRSKMWDGLLRVLRDARQRCDTRLSVELTTDIDSLPGREFRLEVLAPIPTIAAKGPGSTDHEGRMLTTNAMSAVIRVWRGGVPLALLPGDIDSVGLDNLLSYTPKPNAKLLVFPHHGGSSGSEDPGMFAARLCSAVQPEVVVFSLERGRFSMPKPSVVKGVLDAVPDAHILCTQLSEHCAAVVPVVPPTHLSGRVAHGFPRRHCCGGTLVLDVHGSLILSAPTQRAHLNFVDNSVPTALCRRTRRLLS